MRLNLKAPSAGAFTHSSTHLELNRVNATLVQNFTQTAQLGGILRSRTGAENKVNSGLLGFPFIDYIPPDLGRRTCAISIQ